MEQRIMDAVRRAQAYDKCGNYKEAQETYEEALKGLVQLLKVEKDPRLHGALKSKARSIWERIEALKPIVALIEEKQKSWEADAAAQQHQMLMEECNDKTIEVIIDSEERQQALKQAELREENCECLLTIDPVLLYRITDEKTERKDEGCLRLLEAIVSLDAIPKANRDIFVVNEEGTFATVTFIVLGALQIPLTPYIPCVRTTRTQFVFPSGESTVFIGLELPMAMSEDELDAVETLLSMYCMLKRSSMYGKVRDDGDISSLPEDHDVEEVASMISTEIVSAPRKERRIEDEAIFEGMVPQEKLALLLRSATAADVASLVRAIQVGDKDKIRRIAHSAGLGDVEDLLTSGNYTPIYNAMRDYAIYAFTDAVQHSEIPALVEALKFVDVDKVVETLKEGTLEDVMNITVWNSSNFQPLIESVIRMGSSLASSRPTVGGVASAAVSLTTVPLHGREVMTSLASPAGVEAVIGGGLILSNTVVEATTDGIDMGIQTLTDRACGVMDTAADIVKTRIGERKQDIMVPVAIRLPLRLTAKVTPILRIATGSLVQLLTVLCSGVMRTVYGILQVAGVAGDGGYISRIQTVEGGVSLTGNALIGVARTLVSLEDAGLRLMRHAVDSVVDVADHAGGEQLAGVVRDSTEIVRDVAFTAYNIKTLGYLSVIRSGAKGAVKQTVRATVRHYYYQIKLERERQKVIHKAAYHFKQVAGPTGLKYITAGMQYKKGLESSGYNRKKIKDKKKGNQLLLEDSKALHKKKKRR